MAVNVNDKTRDNATPQTTPPPTGNSFVDKLASGQAVVEQRPDQGSPVAHRPRT